MPFLSVRSFTLTNSELITKKTIYTKILTLPIKYGDKINIIGMNDEIYVLSLEEYDGIPEPGTEECIEITFSTGEQILAQGHVKFIAGYLEFDEYGGAGDGIQDSIEYDADEILKALNKLIIDINNKFINEKIKYIYFSGLIKNDYNS